MNRTKILGWGLVALALVLAGTGPVAAGPGAQTGEMARVRFVNALPGAPRVEAYVDSVLYASGLSTPTGYLDALPGERVISFREPGAAVDLAALSVALEAGERVTLAAVGPADAAAIWAIPDDVSAPARNAARLKAVHAAPGLDPVGITLGDLSLAEELAYGDVSVAAQVLAGTYDITVTGPDGDPLLTLTGQDLAGNRAVTLFVTGAADTAIGLVVATSSVLAPDGSSHFRFANMAPDAGPVAVYVNGESVAIYPQVGFSTVTHVHASGPGPHHVAVYPPGSGPADGAPLAETEAALAPGTSMLFALHGSGRALDVTAFPGDLSPVPRGAARLQVIHLATGNPPLDATRLDGAVLAEGLAVGEVAERLVPGGALDLRLTASEDGALLMERTGFNAPAGSLTQVIAFDNDPDAPYINAWAVSTPDLPQYALVRWAHVAPGTLPVDVYRDGEQVAAALSPGEVTDYALIPPGRYDLVVYRRGADPDTAEPLAAARVTLGGGNTAQTVLFRREADGRGLSTLPDSLDLVPTGEARVRFVHAAPGAGPVTIRSDDGRAWVDALYFGQHTFNRPLPAGELTFAFQRGEETVVTTGPLAWEPGTASTLVLAGGSGRLEVLVLEVQP